MTTRIAVFASGSGSNLQAILDYIDQHDAAPMEVVMVVSDRRGAQALERAAGRGIATLHVPLASTGDHEFIRSALDARGADLIALAGYLRLVPAQVVTGFRGRILNVHPALLPAFGGAGMYGARVHEAVIRSGARVSGLTVHFVDEVYDRGPIAAQWPVPVLPGDTASSLAARVLRFEHLVYPRVLHAVAAGLISLSPSGEVIHAGAAAPFLRDVAFAPTLDFDAVTREIDRSLRLNA